MSTPATARIQIPLNLQTIIKLRASCGCGWYADGSHAIEAARAHSEETHHTCHISGTVTHVSRA